MSDFTLVIQLNIPIDKFRKIILSKFHSVHHTLLFKEFDGLGIQNYRHCLEYMLDAWCRIYGDEKSLLVMSIRFFETVIIFA